MNHSNQIGHLSCKEIVLLEKLSAGELTPDSLPVPVLQKYCTLLLDFNAASKHIRAWEVSLPRGKTLSYTGNPANGDKPLYDAPPLAGAIQQNTANQVWPKEINDFASRIPSFETLSETQRSLIKKCMLSLLLEQIPLSIFLGK